MLESLRLIDFKSFVDETIELSPVTFLVGANAAGKSNVFDALRFLRGTHYDLQLSEVLDGEEGRAHDAWKGIRGGAREAARYGTSSFEIHSSWRVVLDGIRNEDDTREVVRGGHHIRVQVKPTVRLLEEGAVDADGRESFTFRRGADGTWTLTPRPAVPPSRDWDTDQSVLWALLGSASPGMPQPSDDTGDVDIALSQAFGRLAFIDIQPDRMRELSHSGPPLRDDGANLSGVLHALAKDPSTRQTFVEWASELCAPELTGIDFIEVEELGDVMAVLVERDGRRISARSMSDGTLRFLGILAALYTAEPDSVVCFEELGAGLHPARIQLLIELLESVHRERGVQTIVTTHNPGVLRWLDEERLGRVLLFARVPDEPGTLVRRLDQLPHFSDTVQSMGIEEMLTNRWLEAAL